MTGPTIIAALFDLDGLAVDSEPLHVEAWRRAMLEAGAGWDPAWIGPYFGQPVTATAAALARDHSLAPERVQALRDRHFDDLISDGIPPRPGLGEAVGMFREAGLAVGLVTSGIRDYVEHALQGLDGVAFDAIVTREDVSRPKPDPEPYRRGAEALGVQPARCAALEDAPTGIASALGAGMIAVAVPNEHTAGLDFGHASHVADSLVEAAAWILAFEGPDGSGDQ
jgi:beta-phosphoglucomutase-like phosphatase (HAD superfamily)